MMNLNTMRRAALFAAAFAVAAGVTGCGMNSAGGGSSSGPSPTVKTVSGQVFGGQQPVSGSRIQLYAVGNAGYKSGATPLLTQTVTTGTGGDFSLTGLWNCNDAATYGTNPLLYIVATGGDPGIGSANSAIAMMTALGPCSTLTASSFIMINEATTTAAAYALSPFMTDATHVGAPVAEMSGLSHAFDTAQALANSSTGVSPGAGVTAGEVIPTSEIYTLSNIMAACVNSTGSGICDTLFSLTVSPGGVAPHDTLASMLNIAAAPLQNVSQLFNILSPAAPFQPSLHAVPADWTMMVKFTGNGLAGPAGVALDGNGNAWIANGNGAGITGLSNNGTSLTGAGGYGTSAIFGAQGVAVDRTGSVWIADPLLSSVFKLTVVNNSVQSSAVLTNGLNGPVSIAVDAANRVWVANFGDGSVTQMSSEGLLLNGSPITLGGTLQAPAGVAIDASNHAWITDNAASTVVELNSAGALVSAGAFTDNAMLAPVGVATDSQGRVWIAGNGNSGVSVFTSSGTSLLTAPVTGGGLSQPTAIAIDGSGQAWLVDSVTAGGITRVSADATTAVGKLGTLSAPAAVAIDNSGSVWTANSGDDSVSKFIGLATPVHTPIAAGLAP